jgi:hypothetical protein
MASFDNEKTILERSLVRKRFHPTVAVHRQSLGDEIDPEQLMLIFPDGHQEFGDFSVLRSLIEEANSVEQLKASCIAMLGSGD